MYSKDPKVSIVKCPEHEQIQKVKESVLKACDYIGGLESIINTGDNVLIKPNLLSAASYTTGATTNPNVVVAIAQLCKEAGAKDITIGEGSAIGHDTEKVFKKLGFKKIAEEYGYKLVNFHNDNFEYVMNPMGKRIKRIRIPRTFIESNVVINVPVMKTHDALSVTLGLKNMKGIIHPSDKKRFHKWGLVQSVVDLGYLAMPELTIVDGTIGLEGMGPVIGEPVGLGLILASTDTVAVDRVCMEIMGFDLDEIEYIKLAGENKLGCTELNRINIMGEELVKVKRPFARLSISEKLLEDMGIKVLPCDSCSGCNNAVNSYIHGLYVKGKLEKLRGKTLIYGQSPYIPECNTDDIIFLGSCTRKKNINETNYVPGCPPHPIQINDLLDR